MIRSLLWRPGQPVEKIDGIADFDAMFAQPEAVLWVDMIDPNDQESFILTHDFHFHPLAIEDVIEEEDAISELSRSKIDDYKNYIYAEFSLTDGITHDEGIKLQEVHLFLTKNTVVTVRDENHRIFNYLLNKALRDDRLMSRGAEFLFHNLLDVMVDNYNSILEYFEKEVDAIEDDVLEEPDEETVKNIFTLRRDIYDLKRIVLPQREMLLQISRGQFPLISERAALYFRDIHDHLTRIIELSESHRDTLISALEVYFSNVSTKTNQIIKILTIFTVILMPPTFLVGLWGMNFRYMPELEWKYGYLIFWAILIIITLIMVLFFKRKKWI
ncbi:MAG: magnesium and cobalt transport protein CorA [candidate division Zixibacteria bacterium HGW-Zixibacteria-1]|nr:MAG: magnesium and cobalt transport protein CorA [candidate division Zixibacteria bacterium HGW-Zixibacteria-1]